MSQAKIQEIKQSIWKFIHQIFTNYSKHQEKIKIEQATQIITEVLQSHPQEISQSTRNLFRVNLDKSGLASKLELGNYIIHQCGELALRRMNMRGSMLYRLEKQITLGQFNQLFNYAVGLLGTNCPDEVVRDIFTKVDEDKDDKISYAEYSKIYPRYFYEKGNIVKPVNTNSPRPVVKSKLRTYIWSQLRILYDQFISKKPTKSSLESMFEKISAGRFSTEDFSFFYTGLLNFSFERESFEVFGKHFISLLASLGLEHLSSLNIQKRTINRLQFKAILRDSFGFTKLYQFKNVILDRLFDKIDNKGINYIDYQQYIYWVNQFLAAPIYDDLKFYALEDDLLKDPSDPFENQNEINIYNNPEDQHQFLAQYKQMQSWDRFIKMTQDQYRGIIGLKFSSEYQAFERQDLLKILINVLNYGSREYEETLLYFNNFTDSSHQKLSLNGLLANIICIYFFRIIFWPTHQGRNIRLWQTRKLSSKDFIFIFHQACPVFKFKVPINDLKSIFQDIDTDRDDLIDLEDYYLFIRQSFAKGHHFKDFVNQAQPNSNGQPQSNHNQQFEFIAAVQRQVKIQLQKYDISKSGYFSFGEFKMFGSTFFGEITEFEQKFIFSLKFRDRQRLQSSELESFIINYSVQLALQRFHKKKTFGKRHLTSEQVCQVLCQAYHFVPDITKYTPTFEQLYQKISAKGDLSYVNFLTWISNFISRSHSH